MDNRRIILLLTLLITASVVFAQKVVIDDLTARQSITLNGKKVTEISIDSLFGSANHSRIPTQKAVKDYVDAVAGSSAAIDTFYRSNDTLFIEAGVFTYFAVIPLGASYASELGVSEVAFTIIDAGADTVDLQSVLEEIDFLIANLNTLVGDGTTNLAYTASPTNGIVTNDKGDDATLPLGDDTNAGLASPGVNSAKWTSSGANNILRNSNVGVGVDPASIARLVIRGSGATSSTLTAAFQNSAGLDLFSVRDDGLVKVGVSGTAALQIGSDINFNIPLYFGGVSGNNGKISYSTNGFFLSTAGGTTGLRFTPQNVFPNFNIGSATTSFNGLFRTQLSSGSWQVNASDFAFYQTGTSPISYVNAGGTSRVGGFLVNAGFTTSGGSNSGIFSGFVSEKISSVGSLDTSLLKLKYVVFYNNDSININVPFPDPMSTIRSNWRMAGTGGALQKIYDIHSTGVNDINGNMAVRTDGTAKSWMRGGVALGETSTIATGNKLQVYGRTATEQLVGSSAAPTVTVQVAAGTDATASIVSARSSDIAGIITGETGTASVVAGNWIRVDFVTAYSNAPVVILDADGTGDTTAGDNAAGLRIFWSTVVDTTGFYIRIGGDPSDLTEVTFQISYHVIGK